MDPVSEFRDLCVCDDAASTAPASSLRSGSASSLRSGSASSTGSASSLRSASTSFSDGALFKVGEIEAAVRAWPCSPSSASARVAVVHGRAGSGRSYVAEIVRRAMAASYVEVDETYSHSVNVTLTRRALDKHIAASRSPRVFVLLAKYERDGVLSLCTVDFVDEGVMRAKYGVGVQRFLRNYGGNIVQMHNHRAFGIEPTTSRFAQPPLEPRSSTLIERMFRAQRGDPEPYTFAGALVARYETEDEEDVPELIVEVLSLVLAKQGPKKKASTGFREDFRHKNKTLSSS